MDISLKQEVIEMLALTFKADEINEIGVILFRKFDLHQVSGTRSTETVSSRRAATILVEYCMDRKGEISLLEFLIQIDDSVFLGRSVSVEGLETFLLKLSQYGFFYNPDKRRIVSGKDDPLDMKNWGALKEGKTYGMSVLSLDIVENSRLVKRYGSGKMKKLYASLWAFLRERLDAYNGRIWSWAGDGGLIAFAMKKHLVHSVKFAMEIQTLLILFNHDPSYPLKEPIQLRIGIDTGKVPFSFNTGEIISEVINCAAHLEKGVCLPGHIAVSFRVYESMGKGYADFFSSAGQFEGEETYLSIPLTHSIKEAEPVFS
ncbi:adenylate/guanylate cyclase domain-containing protein [Spirochaeta isovalerica]|uniref:Class 3 adenylate cyclase n=1 Tax=Spirochaeta isovalerica TaxID=150 RepID=A0A841RB78_9SPIO|nr:adenylate/guanylate cyclase domain-containing protein [Spirochaeta isovalerica]MBB6480611.1 class 3 adenylate cyclase [Spirochaeta isovalerica]